MVENTFCMSRELKESDTRLNVVYGIVIRALAKPQLLQSAQRTWIAFRDAECMFQNEAMQGGSGYNFSMDLCLMQLTEQHIATLEAVKPCNGCVEFKSEFYKLNKVFGFPERKRVPASGKPGGRSLSFPSLQSPLLRLLWVVSGRYNRSAVGQKRKLSEA